LEVCENPIFHFVCAQSYFIQPKLTIFSFAVTAGYILTFYPHNDISFDGKWFLRILVPPIVFEAALSIDKRSFSRHVVPILFYAVLGTLLASAATAFVVHEGSKLLHCETIPYAEALTFGALISSIDPVAVLSVLGNMGMTDQDTIYVVIFGESLLNDGVAIVLFETLVHFLDDGMVVDSNAVTAATIHFLVVFIGSFLIGIGYGLCSTLYYWVMLGCQTPLVEVLMFCCWALLPYYVCDGIEWSGIVAVVAGGFIMDMYVVGEEKMVDLPIPDSDSDNGNDSEKSKERRRRSMARRAIFSKEGLLSKEAKTHIKFVTEIIATMMETAIFAYLGLFLFSSRYHWNINHVIIAISACCLSRAIMIPSLSSIANWTTKSQQSRAICSCNLQEIHQQFHSTDTASSRSNQAAGVVIDSKMQLVLWFAGLRGAMSFALVEHIPQYDAVSGEGTRLKSELKAMTSACIIFTVFVLGGGTFYMMDALGLAPRAKSDNGEERETEMIELLSAVTPIDAEDGADDKSHGDTSGTSSTEIFTQRPSTNTLRRPGKPVRRQRNGSRGNT
jgi:NhaP-type Na+/H+ or K+/H+ antiporter